MIDTKITTGNATLYLGDCLEVLPILPPDSVDSIVTDPPYGLSFMGKDWDHGVPGVHFWTEALRVAKPGAHLLAFGGTRTFHRLACAIEDAGWEIRDTIMWVYGSGFPKSLNVQQAINKADAGFPQGGADPRSPNHGKFKGGCTDKSPAGRGFGAGAGAFMQEQGKKRGDDEGPLRGWGTALKPAWEPIIVARKPLDGTVAENCLKHGTGALNVDGCRVAVFDDSYARNCSGDRGHDENRKREMNFGMTAGKSSDIGRWPANLIHDGTEEVIALFPEVASGKPSGIKHSDGARNAYGSFGGGIAVTGFGDSGSAARFFYCAKASNEDREKGNTHPTVKPTDLMRYLCRLVTPPGGVVLDLFMGSGSTGKAAIFEGFHFIGIDKEAEYIEIARKRIKAVEMQPLLLV